ncbi:hypothetical protein TRVA0_019S02388 [Trichomonascus vanleenenianus]|uniref:uncharacterized protein n=1 Tax=Trichomonascus vanleenenianus TaxID=2268995 RepID=UPI003ECBA2D9
MVSKHSFAFLSLAVASALGQCTLSSGGQTIVTAMNNFITAIGILQQGIAYFETGSTGHAYINAVYVYVKETVVASDVTKVSQALSSPESELTDCDFTTFISMLGDAAPAFVSALQNLADQYSHFVDTSTEGTITPGLQEMTDNFLQLITTVYGSLPGCEYTGQAVDTVNDITAAVVFVQKVYGLSASTSPTEPASCLTSTTGGSAPTLPPTCKKLFSQAKAG